MIVPPGRISEVATILPRNDRRAVIGRERDLSRCRFPPAMRVG